MISIIYVLLPVQPLRDQTVTEGNRVTLECVVNPFPIPEKVQWFRNEVEIHSSPDYLITYYNGVCKLVIAEAFPEDTGKFKCIVSVSGVSNSSDMHLKVQGMLNILHSYLCGSAVR